MRFLRVRGTASRSPASLRNSAAKEDVSGGAGTRPTQASRRSYRGRLLARAFARQLLARLAFSPGLCEENPPGGTLDRGTVFIGGLDRFVRSASQLLLGAGYAGAGSGPSASARRPDRWGQAVAPS